jgi:hypothetical protein
MREVCSGGGRSGRRRRGKILPERNDLDDGAAARLTFECAPIVIEPSGVDPRQQHVRTALNARGMQDLVF